jgi:hypothetical protein
MAPRLDFDGYYTVDYFVTMVLIFASITTLVLRNCHPHLFAPIVYTTNLWVKGCDTFVDFGNGKKVTLTLYDWLHTQNYQRAAFLMQCARRVDPSKQPLYSVTSAQPFEEAALHEFRDDGEDPAFKRMREAFAYVVPNHPNIDKSKEDEEHCYTKFLMADCWPQADKPPKKDKMRVVCIHPFVAFTDIHEISSKQNTQSFGWRRARVGISAGTQGEVLGKDSLNMVVVQWDKATELGDYFPATLWGPKRDPAGSVESTTNVSQVRPPDAPEYEFPMPCDPLCMMERTDGLQLYTDGVWVPSEEWCVVADIIVKAMSKDYEEDTKFPHEAKV